MGILVRNYQPPYIFLHPLHSTISAGILGSQSVPRGICAPTALIWRAVATVRVNNCWVLWLVCGFSNHFKTLKWRYLGGLDIFYPSNQRLAQASVQSYRDLSCWSHIFAGLPETEFDEYFSWETRLGDAAKVACPLVFWEVLHLACVLGVLVCLSYFWFLRFILEFCCILRPLSCCFA